MRRFAKNLRWMLLLLGSGLLSPAFPLLHAASLATSTFPTPQTLVLYSYGYGARGVEMFSDGFISATDAAGERANDTFFEYLDLERNQESGYREQLINGLRAKYDKRRIAAIVTVQQPALEFLLKEGRDLAPDAPVITVQAPVPSAAEQGDRRVISQLARFDIEGTLQLASRLFPDTRLVLVVSGSSKADRAMADAVARAASKLGSNLRFEYTTDRTLQEIHDRASALPANSIILFTQYNSDSKGRIAFAYEVEAKLIRHANAPVFGLYDFNLKNGGVGGSVISVRKLGQATANLAQQIESGAYTTQEISVSLNMPASLMLDWAQLERWGGDTGKIPENTLILNKPPGLWEGHKTAVLGTGALLFVLFALIAALLTNRRQRSVLFEIQNRYQTLVEWLPDPVCVYQNGALLYVNPAAVTLVGAASTEDLIGKTALDFVHPEQHAFVSEYLRNNAKNKPDRSGALIEIKLIKANGLVIDVEIQGTCITYHGKPAIQCLVRDISERKRIAAQSAQENDLLEALVSARTAALAAAEARMRLILESSADGLLGLDRSGRITFMNPAACEMLGYLPEDLQGKNVHDTIHHSHADGRPYPASKCAVIQAIAAGVPLRVENDFFWRADGNVLPVSLAVHPMSDRDDLIGAVLGFSDTTPRRAAEAAREAALAEAERLAHIKGEFLANMSHEIRTPLNGVLGIAQLGYRKSEGRSEARQAFSRIIESGRLLMGVIDDILDFSKIESGKLRIDAQTVRLLSCIELSLDTLQDRATTKGIFLHFRPAPDLPVACRLDALRLEQILMNLLSNAIKFTEHGGVTLSVNRDHDFLVFVVEDSGIGMDAAQIDKIFEPFEQADGSTTRRFGGTGLGLSITRRLIELMAGRICVHSVRGQGSRFEVRLPLIEADVAELAEQLVGEEAHEMVQDPSMRLTGLRVLVAEDNEVNQLVIGDILTAEGCEVMLVNDGQEAVDALHASEADAFDLVLMDIQMPNMNGYDAGQRFHEFRPTLPVIALTAHAMSEEREKCLQAGMIDTLTKPVDIETLVHTLLRHVGKSASPSARTHALPALPPDEPAEGLAWQGIDQVALEASYWKTPNIVSRLLRTFIDSCRETPEKLRAAQARTDFEELATLAHGMKSVLGFIMATQQAALAVQTELAAKARNDDALLLASRLSDEIERLLSEATALLEAK